MFLLRLLDPKGVDFPLEKSQQTKNRGYSFKRTEETELYEEDEVVNREKKREHTSKFIQFTPVNEGSYVWPSR